MKHAALKLLRKSEMMMSPSSRSASETLGWFFASVNGVMVKYQTSVFNCQTKDCACTPPLVISKVRGKQDQITLNQLHHYLFSPLQFSFIITRFQKPTQNHWTRCQTRTNHKSWVLWISLSFFDNARIIPCSVKCMSWWDAYGNLVKKLIMELLLNRYRPHIHHLEGHLQTCMVMKSNFRISFGDRVSI